MPDTKRKAAAKPRASRISLIEDKGVEAYLMRNFRKTMKRDAIERAKHNAPIAKYDVETKRAYLEYPDGRIVYADEA